MNYFEKKQSGHISALQLALPALLLAIIILVPFLNKAFTIDDTVFLFEAKHTLSDPLHPTAFEMTWRRVPERVSQIVPTGPVMAWLLVPAILAGGAEWVAHSVQLAMLLIAIIATVSLALRLRLAPAWAAISAVLLVATPAVLGMSGTAMPDIPAMALGVAGLERLVAWRDNFKMHQGFAATLLLGLAPHARTHLALLFGVAVFLLVGDIFSYSAWKRGPWTRWVPLVAALLITSTVAIITHDPHLGAGNVPGTLVTYSSTSNIIKNSIAFSIHWVLSMAFALPWAVLRWRSILKRLWFLLAASGIAAFLLFQAHGNEAHYVMAPIAGLGVTCLIDVFIDAFERSDGIQVTLGFWLLLPLPAIIYIHLPSKYLIASAPAAVILLARTASGQIHVARYILGLTLVTGTLLGIAILRADNSFSNVSRVAAQKLIVPQVQAGRKVWYIGHWGFQWYAEKAGARCYNEIPPYPISGDLIAYNSNPFNEFNRKDLEKYSLLAQVADRRPGGRVMSQKDSAGFYSNYWGYLPWAWGNGVIDTVELWQVSHQQLKYPINQ